MSIYRNIVVDFKRCFFPGSFTVDRYDSDYVTKAEDHSLNKASQAELAKVCESLKNHVPQHVLDIGCNSGRPLAYLCDHFNAQGTGVDVNLWGIDKASQDYPERRFIHYYGDNLPHDIENASVDHVMIHHVLGHVNDPALTIKEAWRALRVGGTLSIITPNTYFKVWQFPFNILNKFAPDVSVLRYYYKESLEYLLKQHSFRILELSTFGATPTACPKMIRSEFLLRVYAIAQKTH